MHTDKLTALAKANAAYPSRGVNTGMAKFALGHADSRKCASGLITHDNVL